jgi:hypothetical protein
MSDTAALDPHAISDWALRETMKTDPHLFGNLIRAGFDPAEAQQFLRELTGECPFCHIDTWFLQSEYIPLRYASLTGMYPGFVRIEGVNDFTADARQLAIGIISQIGRPHV